MMLLVARRRCFGKRVIVWELTPVPSVETASFRFRPDRGAVTGMFQGDPAIASN